MYNFKEPVLRAQMELHDQIWTAGRPCKIFYFFLVSTVLQIVDYPGYPTNCTTNIIHYLGSDTKISKKVSFSQTLNGPFSIDTDPFRTSRCALERARAETSISAEFCIVRNPENPTPPRWSGLQISKIHLHYTVVLDNRLLLQYNKSVIH